MNTKLLVKSFALAVLSLAPFTAPSAQGLGFQNCTGRDLRIHIYNNKDAVLAVGIPFAGGGLVKKNEVRIWHQAKSAKASSRAIKVFDSQLVDKLRLVKHNLHGQWDYRIVEDSNGEYQVQPAGHPVGSCPSQ